MTFQRIDYARLNARQQETFNFQKVSGILADYGFACIRLNDDWQGADFIAQHIDGDTYLKVQLKGRLTVARKYEGKRLWMCFPVSGRFYLLEHDILLARLLERFPDQMAVSKSWVERGQYSWGAPGQAVLEVLGEAL